MDRTIGLRLEDKNQFERRVPLTPDDVKRLITEQQVQVVVQSSPIRIFKEGEYVNAGAAIVPDLTAAPIVFGIKEIPAHLFQAGKTYIFFSHTIKGQDYNMPMLKRLMDLQCNLIDYERITDDKGRRLVFFGNYAGLAGMIDTLWGLGKRLKHEGKATPFELIDHAYKYNSLQDAEDAVKRAGHKIANDGLPAELAPMIFGFSGYGNVSKGAQEIVNLLPVIEITPADIEHVFNTKKNDVNHVYKVVFKEEDMVEPTTPGATFELQDYYKHPENYRSKMEQYLPYLTCLMNCIYWEKRYPRVLTKDFAKKLYIDEKAPALKIIGDISCDIGGGIECTTMCTEPDCPVFVYNPVTGESTPGTDAEGLAIMSIDNLPCELARESSTAFSKMLVDFVPALVNADWSKATLDDVQLPETLKRAVILYHGKLTPTFQYLESQVEKHGKGE